MTPVVEMVQVRMLKFRLVRRLEVWPGPAPSLAADPGQRIFLSTSVPPVEFWTQQNCKSSASANHWFCAKCPQPTSFRFFSRVVLWSPLAFHLESQIHKAPAIWMKTSRGCAWCGFWDFFQDWIGASCTVVDKGYIGPLCFFFTTVSYVKAKASWSSKISSLIFVAVLFSRMHILAVLVLG